MYRRCSSTGAVKTWSLHLIHDFFFIQSAVSNCNSKFHESFLKRYIEMEIPLHHYFDQRRTHKFPRTFILHIPISTNDAVKTWRKFWEREETGPKKLDFSRPCTLNQAQFFEFQIRWVSWLRKKLQSTCKAAQLSWNFSFIFSRK